MQQIQWLGNTLNSNTVGWLDEQRNNELALIMDEHPNIAVNSLVVSCNKYSGWETH